MQGAVQEPEGGIDNTLAAAFAQVRQQLAASEAAESPAAEAAPAAEAPVEAPAPKAKKLDSGTPGNTRRWWFSQVR